MPRRFGNDCGRLASSQAMQRIHDHPPTRGWTYCDLSILVGESFSARPLHTPYPWKSQASRRRTAPAEGEVAGPPPRCTGSRPRHRGPRNRHEVRPPPGARGQNGGREARRRHCPLANCGKADQPNGHGVGSHSFYALLASGQVGPTTQDGAVGGVMTETGHGPHARACSRQHGAHV
jgi:hypothetical protein